MRTFGPDSGVGGLAGVLSVMVLAACSMPRDPSGTMDRVSRTHVLRLGIVDGAQMGAAGRDTLERLLRKTGARAEQTRGDSEALLARLEHGDLDLVYGDFPRSSPWSRAVHFGKAQGRLGKVPKSESVPRFAMMNGENGWIMLVGKAGR